MPVRIRITLLFVALVIIILGMVCTGIYYFSYAARAHTIETRLTNRAITTARLLAQKEIVDLGLVRRIDSLTTIALKNKTVLAYNALNHKIYNYSDVAGDTLDVNANILEQARSANSTFFTIGDKEAVAFFDPQINPDSVVISAGEDVEGKKNLQILFKILLISFLAGNALVFITGYFFSSRLLLPVRKITADVQAISAQNLARRIETGHSKDEWYKLADTLNQVLNRPQESFELQSRFIANASHELSTPLTSISSQLEVSLQRPRDAGEYRLVMESIHLDVRHMSKLTQTLLEFAKASGSAAGLEINLVRMDEVLLRLPSEMVKINPGYTVNLKFDDLPDVEDSLLVFGNEPLLFTAIRNIVMNACKYSADHRANVALEITGSMILVSICDKGKGIPQAELKSIFQPFYRVEENIAGEGFGLGLSLADRIIKLHKGTISVHSVANTGTCFSISLPGAQVLT